MADDKIYNLKKLQNKLIIISSFDGQKISVNNVKHYRVPSLSLIDFIQECENKNIYQLVDLVIYIPFVLIFGLIFDIIEHIF